MSEEEFEEKEESWEPDWDDYDGGYPDYDFEMEADADAYYERMRDDAGDLLEEALDEVIKRFTESGPLYYKGEGNQGKMIEHMIVTLQAKLAQKKVLKDGQATL